MDLISLDEAKAHLRLKRVSDHGSELPAVIAAVSEDIRRYPGFDWEQRTYTELRHGNGQPSLIADKAGRPGPPITAVTSIKQNGVALTFATAYSATADVLVDLVRGVFTRRPGSAPPVPGSVAGRWEEGVLNVELVYQAGDALASIPADIKVPAREAVAILFKRMDSKWQGISSRSSGQGSVSIVEELPDVYRSMLERRRRVMVPAA